MGGGGNVSSLYAAQDGWYSFRMNPPAPRLSHERFTRYAWAVLAVNLAVIAWGAVVRATGSGAGCGSHWPLCNGEVVPRSPTVETLIEFSHRATSGVALLLVVALVVAAWRTFERGHPARLGAALSMTFMVGEAAVGAGLVLFELVADNASMARALFMVAHLGNTFFLLAALTLTAHWAGGGEPVRIRRQGALPAVFALALVGTILIGASGAVAALGDTLFPAGSLHEAWLEELSTTSHVLIQLRVYHPLIAVAVGVLLLVGAHLVRVGGSPEARRWARVVQVLVFAEMAVGGLNVVMLAPVWMQVVHLLLADLLWISLVLAAAAGLPASREVRVLAPAEA